MLTKINGQAITLILQVVLLVNRTMINIRYAYTYLLILVSFPVCLLAQQHSQAIKAKVTSSEVWVADQGDGTYRNPIIHADYSDPDIVRVGDDFFMTASSFNAVPALPVLHSKDLVNWKIVNHAIQRFPDPYFDEVQHGNGVWAPSIRYHEGWYYIYWGDPDRGIYRVRTQDPFGEWSAPELVKKAYGNIDACPLWDDDGKVYLVHAFANSRAGVKNLLQVQELSADGATIADQRAIVYDGHQDQPTLEGPKFYKRNGYYYIFAPAGGVSTGWQLVLRSKNVWGPYEARKVLEQGSTDINGPHQGGWVELENGEQWFVHFQDKGAYGRVVHLQPMQWADDWPVMGKDLDSNGVGEPVTQFQKPQVESAADIAVPQTSTEFEKNTLGLQWQWQGNFYDHWYKFSEGKLQLQAQTYPALPHTLWKVPNLLLQKFPAPTFVTTTPVDASALYPKERAGLVIMGLDYAALQLTPSPEGTQLSLTICKDAIALNSEEVVQSVRLKGKRAWLRVEVQEGALCQFSYSENGEDFTSIGEPFQAREGRWIGAKVGLFAVTAQQTGMKGQAAFDYFHLEPVVPEDQKIRQSLK